MEQEPLLPPLPSPQTLAPEPPVEEPLAPEPAAPGLALVPEASGNPTWVRWGSERVMVDGRPRSVFREEALNDRDFALMEEIVVGFLRSITVQEQAYETYVDPRRGQRKRPRPVERPAKLEDVQGVNLRMVSPTGARLRSEDIILSVGMTDGRRYHLNPATGRSIRTCLFCQKFHTSITRSPDGAEYHEACFDAAVKDHRRAKQSERDIVVAKARAAAEGA